MNLIAFSSLLSQVVLDIVTGFLAIIGQTTIGAISSSGNLAANIFNSVSLVGQSAMELRSIEPVIETFFVDKPIVRATKKPTTNSLIVYESKIYLSAMTQISRS